jgi:hypothetical protein
MSFALLELVGFAVPIALIAIFDRLANRRR